MQRVVKDARAEEHQCKIDLDPRNAVRPPDIDRLGFLDQCKYAHNMLIACNAEKPTIFRHLGGFADIFVDGENASIRPVNAKRLQFHLTTTGRFYQAVGQSGKLKQIQAPKEIAEHMWQQGPTPDFRLLRGAVRSPMFTRSGALIATPGYDATGYYYCPPPQFTLPPLPNPSDEAAKVAARLLIEEVFADFPLAGLSRAEIMQQAFSDKGVPAVANLLALTLLPFVREMIAGPTPGHLITKPAAGTGASKLSEIITMIALGAPASATPTPPNKEEFDKTVNSLVMGGAQVAYFDNINATVDSGVLASVLTAKTHAVRVFGSLEMHHAPVRCVWILTGNGVTMTSELVRRLCMIDLDARIDRPETRTDFRHENLEAWVRNNRGRLVAACLTLVQNWIAKGKQRDRASVLASFEDWSETLGGILKAAGINGFMQNRDRLRALATVPDAKADAMQRFIEALASDPLIGIGTPLRMNGKALVRGVNGEGGGDKLVAGKLPTVSLYKWLHDNNQDAEQMMDDVANGKEIADDTSISPILVHGTYYDDRSLKGPGALEKAIAQQTQQGTVTYRVTVAVTDESGRPRLGATRPR